jgi:hypothetical protein
MSSVTSDVCKGGSLSALLAFMCLQVSQHSLQSKFDSCLHFKEIMPCLPSGQLLIIRSCVCQQCADEIKSSASPKCGTVCSPPQQLHLTCWPGLATREIVWAELAVVGDSALEGSRLDHMRPHWCLLRPVVVNLLQSPRASLPCNKSCRRVAGILATSAVVLP